MIVTLTNSGIRKKDIEENFNISYKSIIKYTTIFNNSQSDEDLYTLLKTPGRTNYKLNTEIINFKQFHKL